MQLRRPDNAPKCLEMRYRVLTGAPTRVRRLRGLTDNLLVGLDRDANRRKASENSLQGRRMTFPFQAFCGFN